MCGNNAYYTHVSRIQLHGWILMSVTTVSLQRHGDWPGGAGLYRWPESSGIRRFRWPYSCGLQNTRCRVR